MGVPEKIGKSQKVKLSPFVDGMILHEENPKDSTKKAVRINNQIQ